MNIRLYCAMWLILAVMVFPARTAAGALDLKWPADAQSTTGPTPPPEAMRAPSGPSMDSVTIISAVPAYIWKNGCGPTALGMVVGYWDKQGFSELVAGDASTQTSGVNNMISSTGNYSDYCLPLDYAPGPLLPDKSEPPPGDQHQDDCLADYMFTSQSWYLNYYGWSWYSHVPGSFTGYVAMKEPWCRCAAANYGWWSLTWDKLRSEIDAGRPCVFLVDSDADGSTDHFVTVIGYGVSGGTNMYACLDTWSTSLRWCEFAPMSPGQSFGVYGATFVSIDWRSLGELKMSIWTGEAFRTPPSVVTAVFPGYFYIQSRDRSCGIRVNKANHGAQVRDLVRVAGYMWTNSDGERCIEADSVDTLGAALTLEPLCMRLRDLGGGDWYYGGNTGQRGVTGGVGLNNIGQLVRACGALTPGDATSFYLDDGSAERVKVYSSLYYPLWSYVTVTGASSCEVVGSDVARVIRATDVQPVNPSRYTGEMVYVPAGSFLMGNSGVGDDLYYSQQYDCSNEFPQHSVYLSGYWIGKHEVTRGEYRRFMDDSGYDTRAYWSTDGWNWKETYYRTQPDYWNAQQNWGSPPGAFTQTDDYPVIGVTYYEAEAFCNWAGGHLPTEAQWEKAARWNPATAHPNIYPWGDAWDSEKCNCWNDSLYAGYQTAPVGSYPAGVSPYGCQDMSGNAVEWCKDRYSATYYSETPPGGWSDPQGPSGSGGVPVLRGGSWYWSYDWYGNHLRCAQRGCYFPYSGNYDFGFRLAQQVVYTISGRVTFSWTGEGMEGVEIPGLPGNPVTDSQGYYHANVPPGWSGQVEMAGEPGLYSYSPSSRTYSNVQANFDNQDYVYHPF